MVIITLGVGFAAINTGNNLLYLVLGMLLSLMVTSGVLSELTLRRVWLHREPMDPLVAGQFGYIRVTVENRKRWFASFSVEVSEVFDDAYGIEQSRGYVLHLRPGQKETARIRLRSTYRGEYQSAGLSMSTRFPFSFFRKSRLIVEPATLVVHPKPARVRLPALPARLLGALERGQRTGTSGDIYGLRDYRSGDAARDVHWKASARRRRLVAKEMERPAARAVVVALPSALGERYDEERFEWRVQRAAGLALGLLEQGYSVGLVSHDGVVAPSQGPGHRRRVLDHLARVDVLPLPDGVQAPPLNWPAGMADRVVVDDSTQISPFGTQTTPERGSAGDVPTEAPA